MLPNGTGKTSKVIVFAQGDQAKAAEDAGADIVGAEDLVQKIQDGWLDFDVAVATPPMMAQVWTFRPDSWTERLDAKPEDRYRYDGHGQGC